MPMYKNERLKQNKKVSIEYPVRMVVKGKTVYDQFPDWYPIMQQDRYELASAFNSNQDVAINYQGSAGSQTLDIRAHGQSVCHQAATQFQYNQGYIPANENETTPIRPTPTYSFRSFNSTSATRSTYITNNYLFKMIRKIIFTNYFSEFIHLVPLKFRF